MAVASDGGESQLQLPQPEEDTPATGGELEELLGADPARV